MTKLYKNATPQAYFTGFNDTPNPGSDSGGVLSPLHCPLSMIFAEWGPSDDALFISGGEINTQYGEETWDVRSKFFNHTNLFAAMFQANANSQFILRMDAEGSKKASGRLSLEVVVADIPQYQRSADGKFIRDVDGLKIPEGADLVGTKLRWRWDPTNSDDFVMGGGTQGVGTLTGADGEVAAIYPIMDFEATYKGSRGSRLGIGLFQPKSTNQQPVDAVTIDTNKSMINRFSVTETASSGGTESPWYTLSATRNIDFSFDDSLLSVNDAALNLTAVYDTNYKLSNQVVNGMNVTGPTDNIHVYRDNLETVLAMLVATESAVADNEAHVDADNIYSINTLDGSDHYGVPYYTVLMATALEVADEENAITPSEGSNFKLGHGNDGDVSYQALDTAVANLADNFGMTGVSLKDYKRYPFHNIWDSGFTTETTSKLFKIMGKRPDVYVATGTHEHGKIPKSSVDELAVAGTLANAAALQVESSIYQTPSTRGHIMPWSISLPNSKWTHPTATNYDLAQKISLYLGANTGIWNVDRAVDKYPNNVVASTLVNYNYEELSVREAQWANQMIAIEYSDMNELIYSGLQTVNPNDSSVLNSMITVMGCIHATWVAIKAYARFVGRTTKAELLIQQSNEYMTGLLAGIDSSKIIATPNTFISDSDAADGYAWSTDVDVQSGSMRTVNTIRINSSTLEES